jgi:RNA polymerase sigma-70 factor (ECF subfamily)
MDERDWLAERFEEHRPRLRAVSYRILGSRSDAEDAVQDAWLRLSRSDTSGVANLGGWLTTIVARTCLNMLSSRQSRREELVGENPSEPTGGGEEATDPEHQALLADSVGLALLVVLDTLTPAERLAFVLHDMFDVPFEQIAPIVERSPAAARQLASRARRRVRGAGTTSTDPIRRKEIVTAFLAATRGGDFDALLALLDPDVVLRADPIAVQLGASKQVHGAAAVAGFFSKRARTAQPARIKGAAAAVWAPGGQPRVAFLFTIPHGKIAAVELVADPERLRDLDLTIIDR